LSDSAYDDYGGWGDAPEDDQPETMAGEVIGGIGHVVEELIEDVEDVVSPASGERGPMVVPVRVTNPPQLPVFGGTQGYALAPGGLPVQILVRRPHRFKARVWVVASVAGQPVTDGVVIGSLVQCQQNNLTAAGNPYWPIGQHLDVENQREWYAVALPSNTDTVYVTVLDQSGETKYDT
jgi:hypothetical protein